MYHYVIGGIMKYLSLIIILLLFSCSAKKEKTAEQKVNELQKMCKNSATLIQKRQSEKSLYERLGREEGIHEFFTRLLLAHHANKNIAHLFKNVDDAKVIRNSTDFLVAGSGGPNKYQGRSMAEVHAKMHVTNADFLAAGKDVEEVMKELGHGENEIQEVICALVSFVPVVVVKD